MFHAQRHPHFRQVSRSRHAPRTNRGRAPVGFYIVDFLCIAHRLVVEADGSQHTESKRDAVRDEWLTREGYKILRFGNHDILTARESVLATIAAACGLPW